MRLFNEVLLGKWLWRFGLVKDAQWRQVIEVKYGCRWGGWCSSSVSSRYGVGLWKNISRKWSSFSHYILYDIGDASRVKFGTTIGVGRHYLLSVIQICFDFAEITRQVWLSL